MKRKKGIAAVPTVIVTFILLLIVLTVMIFVFRTYLGKETKIIGEQIASFGDEDGDDIRNFLDKCPCKCGDQDNDGCPAGQGPTKPKPSTCKSITACT